MRKGKEPQIIRMNCATVIHTQDSFFIYDRSSGEKMENILCIASKNIPENLIKDIEDTKMAKRVDFGHIDSSGYFSFTILLSPKFGYTSQKFEDTIYELFEKYNL